MEETSIFRAITIAVAIFIAIATITAVLSYYNTAKDLVQAIGTGTDYNEIYSDYIENSLLKADANTFVTGAEVINLVNYFYKDEKVQVNISRMTPLFFLDRIGGDLINGATVQVNNINNNENHYNCYLTRIVPSEKFKITKFGSYELGTLVINVVRL